MQHTALSVIPLADDLEDGTEIDILIGEIYNWNFVTAQLIRASQTLTAVNMILGWTLKENVKSISSVSVNITYVLHTYSEPTSIDNPSIFWELEEVHEIKISTFMIKHISVIKLDDDERHSMMMKDDDDERHSVPLP